MKSNYIEQREFPMPALSKPSVQIDDPNKIDEKNHRHMLEEWKFASPNNSNRLNKLIAYSHVLSSQEKFFENKIVYAQLREAISEAINKLHEAIASNPEEHAMKLQEGFRVLKMQPRYIDESDDEFQERLLQHTNKAISTVNADEGNPLLTYSKQAYIYLTKYASCPRINSAYALNNGNLETERASMRLTK